MKTAILNALAGSSSQKPVELQHLLLLGDIDVIGMHLDAMRGIGEINSCQTTRYGITQKLYWLTGVIDPPVKGRFVINKHTMADAAKKRNELPKVQQKTSEVTKTVCPGTEKPIIEIAPESTQDKEIAMTNTTSTHVFGRQEIYSLVVAQPGISQADLIRATQEKFPDVEHKKIVKTIDNMWRMTKLIRFDGEGTNKTFYVNDDKKPAAVPVKRASLPVEKKEVKPELKPDAPVAETDFSLMLSDENNLFVSFGDEVFRLNPNQLARLDRFLARVLPDGVRMPDGVPA